MMSRQRYDFYSVVNPTVDKIIVIMSVPVQPEDWMLAGHNALAIRHCTYWVNIAGATSTAATPTVSAPTTQIFNDVAVCSIMQRIGQGGAP